MNLLQILNYFFKDKQTSKLILELISNIFGNNFNMGALLNNLNLDKLFEVIENFSKKEKSPLDNTQKQFLLSPISDFADKEIIYSLNKYFQS